MASETHDQIVAGEPAEAPVASFDDVEADKPIAVPDSGEATEGGKLKMIVQLLKKCLGVKDIAAVRLSLPASLLEPIPNLEYWQYLDRPDLFAAVNDSPDPLERMLAVLRFAFSKDLKFIRGKVAKPYNSVLGEHFRAHWDVPPIDYHPDPSQPPIHHVYITPAAAQAAAAANSARASSSLSLIANPSDNASIISSKSSKSAASKRSEPVPVQKAAPAMTLAGRMANLSLGNLTGYSSSKTTPSGSSSLLGQTTAGGTLDTDVVESTGAGSEHLRIVFLTEQVSHHPPVSTFHAACPARGLTLTGVDQIAARVSGTTVRIASGTYNRGIYLAIEDGAGNGEGEQYHITHPVAHVNGMLRGNFYVTVSDSTIITCTGAKGSEWLRAVIEYKEESWLGKPQYFVEGVVHTYTPGSTAHEEWTKIKHVPRASIVAAFHGNWRDRVVWKRVTPTSPPAPNPHSSSNVDADYKPLIDLSHLHVVPKTVRPIEKQLPTESRKLWENVTNGLLKKEYSEATKHKHAIEQRQRDLAAERKRKGEEFVPVYFEHGWEKTGIPVLTAEGKRTIEEMLNS